MKGRGSKLFAAVGRLASLAVLAALSTIALTRFAPGYFSDARELDAQYSAGARTTLQAEEQQGSMWSLTKLLIGGWAKGDLGRSRQYDVPVEQLIAPRAKTTAKLLAEGVALGWCVACLLALPLSMRNNGRLEGVIVAPSALLLAIPVGAMAMACMLSNVAGPVLVLTLIVAARDFKFVYKLLRQTRSAPHLLHARAQGSTSYRIALHHLIPPLRTEMFGLAMMSFALALSAVVPIEVIFDLPGLGQLAWSAAMNRDLPVLLAVTLLMALCIGVTSAFTKPANRIESVRCA